MAANDLDLVRQYATEKSEDAFSELVNRHLNLVYSAALRQVWSPQLAEEVAQSVFTDLSRNACKLKPDTILTAWLYQVTRRTAIDVVRRESRRQGRERLAAEMADMNSTSSDWNQVEPLLDEAMDSLGATDRAALLLRYFENKSLREVGASLGTSDDAAQKRVTRAVERLRELFANRGVALGAGSLATIISANAVQGAPPAVAATISAGAVLKGATGGGPALLSAKGTSVAVGGALLSPILAAIGSYFAIRATVNVSKSARERAARIRFGWKIGISTVALATSGVPCAVISPVRHPWWFAISLIGTLVLTMVYVGLVLFWSFRHNAELKRIWAEQEA